MRFLDGGEKMVFVGEHDPQRVKSGPLRAIANQVSRTYGGLPRDSK